MCQDLKRKLLEKTPSRWTGKTATPLKKKKKLPPFPPHLVPQARGESRECRYLHGGGGGVRESAGRKSTGRNMGVSTCATRRRTRPWERHWWVCIKRWHGRTGRVPTRCCVPNLGMNNNQKKEKTEGRRQDWLAHETGQVQVCLRLWRWRKVGRDVTDKEGCSFSLPHPPFAVGYRGRRN